MSSAKRWLLYYLPSYLYAAFIFALSSIPLVVPEIVGEWTDELCHLAEYFFFGLLLARSFKNSRTPYFKRNFLLLAVVVGCLYGLSDEYHQEFVPHRGFEFFDLLANFIGTILGAYVYKYWTRFSATNTNCST